MRELASAWARTRWPGCRVLHELVLGRRRIDLVFVGERDIAGMELKSSVDRLDRLSAQMYEYALYLPEVWVGVAPRWRDHNGLRFERRNMIVVDVDGDTPVTDYRRHERPYRDELVCSRLLELLWYSEACAIAVRTDVIPVRVQKQLHRPKVLKLLARLLTGNEIIEQVCLELRARQLVGRRSDGAVIREAAAQTPSSPATATA